MKITYLAGFAALAFSTSASARWQYTEWGMSAAEVVAASKGAAKAAPADPARKTQNGERLAEGTFQSGEFQFNVQFSFGAAGLGQITMSLDDAASCEAFGANIRRLYGPGGAIGATPVEGKPSQWQDMRSNNVVALSQEKGASKCSVAYWPIQPVLPKS